LQALAQQLKRDTQAYTELLEDLTAHEEEIEDLKADIARRPHDQSESGSGAGQSSAPRPSRRRSLRLATDNEESLSSDRNFSRSAVPSDAAVGQDIADDVGSEAASLCTRLEAAVQLFKDCWQEGQACARTLWLCEHQLEAIRTGVSQFERDALRSRTDVLGKSVLELTRAVEMRDTEIRRLNGQLDSAAEQRSEHMQEARRKQAEIQDLGARVAAFQDSEVKWRSAKSVLESRLQDLTADIQRERDDSARFSRLLEDERCKSTSTASHLEALLSHCANLEQRLALIAQHYDSCMKSSSYPSHLDFRSSVPDGRLASLSSLTSTSTADMVRSVAADVVPADGTPGALANRDGVACKSNAGPMPAVSSASADDFPIMNAGVSVGVSHHSISSVQSASADASGSITRSTTAGTAHGVLMRVPSTDERVTRVLNRNTNGMYV